MIKKLIGLDIGTTSIGGMLIDGASGEVLKSVIQENRSFLHTGRDREKVQDPSVILATVSADSNCRLFLPDFWR